MGYLLHQSPKFYSDLFFGFKLWRILLNSEWLVHLVECTNVSATNYRGTEGVILCISIGDVQQCIVYCLIPLDL